MSEETDIQEDIIKGPGEQLRTARLGRGLTLDQVASALHLKATTIEDLENDIYDSSVSLTFSKGYLRLYAKHLGVPVDEVLDAFDAFQSKPKETAKLQSFSKRVAKQANDDRWMMVTYLILALVLVLFLWWWWQQSEDDATLSQSLSAPTIPPVATEPLPSSQSQQTETLDSEAVEQIGDSASQMLERVEEVLQNAQQTLPDSQPADDDGAAAEIPAEAPQQIDDEPESTDNTTLADEQPVELVFTFSDDCWMTLTDATGEDIAYGVKRAGRVMTVSGLPPFEVVLGAPANVSISYAGQNIDMSGFDVTRTARFSLPLEEE
ncbi:RodZ domain-containing protein [Aestuariibacter salexigens]|uniref:RodZ domain-containing protein n=1 Tax=Aestuariibacter salexigens TaxID=226010 RepID=UPI0003FFDF0B|nr:RodZ domain-containing protein [Aestuariibacter salexigens]